MEDSDGVRTLCGPVAVSTNSVEAVPCHSWRKRNVCFTCHYWCKNRPLKGYVTELLFRDLEMYSATEVMTA